MAAFENELNVRTASVHRKLRSMEPEAGAEAGAGPGHSRRYIRDIAGRDIRDIRYRRDNC